MTLALSVMVASLGLIFVVAALSKIRHPHVFVETVRSYRILPEPIAIWVAALVIAVECFLAGAFLSGWFIKAAIPISALTLLGFGAAVGINLRRGRSIPCGCFGDHKEHISGHTMIRLAVLLLGVILTGLAAVVRGTVDSIALAETRDLPHGLEVAALAVGLSLLAMWFLTLPVVVSLVQPSWRIESARPGLSTTPEG